MREHPVNVNHGTDHRKNQERKEGQNQNFFPSCKAFGKDKINMPRTGTNILNQSTLTQLQRMDRISSKEAKEKRIKEERPTFTYTLTSTLLLPF
jgi:hypothetical protein